MYSGGRVFPGSTDYNLEVNEASTTGLYIYVEDPRGIYTCEIADSNGNIINLNIGVYYDIGVCIPYISCMHKSIGKFACLSIQ